MIQAVLYVFLFANIQQRDWQWVSGLEQSGSHHLLHLKMQGIDIHVVHIRSFLVWDKNVERD